MLLKYVSTVDKTYVHILNIFHKLIEVTAIFKCE